MSKVKPISYSEAQELYEKWRQTGDLSIRDHFVLSIMPYVKYKAKSLAYDDDMRDDLEQAGAIGAMKAFDRYDPDRGANFLTYARWWIFTEQNKLLTNDSVLSANNKRNAGRIGCDVAFALRNVLVDDGVIPHAKGDSSFNAISLYAAITDANTADVNLDNEVDRRKKSEELYSVINSGILTEQEADVIHLRYLSGKEYTLDKIGRKYGVTRERIRQIEASAFDKLREELEE